MIFDLSQLENLDIAEIFDGGNAFAYAKLFLMRWPDGVPVCPDCGNRETYSIKSRKTFKCKACHRHFSLTSGTIFAIHKMSFTDMLASFLLVIDSDRGGFNALQLSRDLGIQYRAAHALGRKLKTEMSRQNA